MIRINLLPVRAARKKESIRQQLSIAGLSILMLFIVLGGFYWNVTTTVSQIRGNIDSARSELGELKKKIGKLSKIKEQKAKVEEKLNIVRDLEAGKKGPLSMLNSISEAIPDLAWVESLKGSGNSIVLSGFAATEGVVADFMRGLERFPELGSVELEIVQKSKKKNYDVVSFTIRLKKERKET